MRRTDSACPARRGPKVGNTRPITLTGSPQSRMALWGKEEQGSGRSFRRQAETELSGLCDDDGTAAKGNCRSTPRRRADQEKIQPSGRARPFSLASNCSVKKTCQWQVFSGGHSGYAARREPVNCWFGPPRQRSPRRVGAPPRGSAVPSVPGGKQPHGGEALSSPAPISNAGRNTAAAACCWRSCGPPPRRPPPG